MKADVLMAITGERSVSAPIDERREASDLTIAFAQKRDFTARGRGSQSVKQPEWTHAECATANGGVKRRHWLAQMYIFRLDNHAHAELVRELIQWAVFERVQRDWPNTYRTEAGDEKSFLVELVHMVLVEIREPWRFARASTEADPRRTQMQASKNTWRTVLSPIYETLMTEVLTWIEIGVAQANRKLSEKY